MKFNWLILLLSPSIITAMYINDEAFGTCNFENWVLVNTTVDWDHEMKNITTNISYNGGTDDNQIYTVHISLCQCNTTECNSTCSGETKVWVEDVDCDSEDLTAEDNVICEIAEDIRHMRRIMEWMNTRYEDIENFITFLFCMNLETFEFQTY